MNPPYFPINPSANFLVAGALLLRDLRIRALGSREGGSTRGTGGILWLFGGTPPIFSPG